VASAREAVAKIRPGLVGVVLAAIVGVSVFSTGQVYSNYLKDEGNRQLVERTALFGVILDNVRQTYIDGNVDIEKLFDTGVNAMLQSLDPYSEYETPKEVDEFMVRTTGKYGGVGLTISKDGDDVVVIAALEGYAYDDGMRPGDRLLSIDGKSVKALGSDEVRDLLRGDPGTSVQLQVQRDGSPEPNQTLTVSVQRRLVRLPDVTLVTTMSNGTGYIRLEGFSENASKEIDRAIRKLQESGSMKALVIDLRDNPGGLLEEAIQVSQLLVPEGTELVSTTGRVYGEGTSISYRSSKPPLLDPKTRLVMLVNSNTASAAEIVTGVVQDTDRGIVVGERTFGKGLVQAVGELPGGGSLKLTVAKYYTPSGRCIQAVTYGGSRLEAKQELPPATSSGVAAPSLDAPDSADDAKPAASGSAASKQPPKQDESVDLPGGLLRMDPRLPSKPSADEEDAKSTYYTVGGRSVKGGGGIGPDVAVAGQKVGELERSLLQQNLFYEFASDWLRRNVAPLEQLAQKVARSPDAVYSEFVTFVRRWSEQPDHSLQPFILQQQLDTLQATLGTEDRTTRATSELSVLRKILNDERLKEFQSEKDTLKVRVRESLLGRLASPTQVLSERAAEDPQVRRAIQLAADENTYQRILVPESVKKPRLPT
jgi:C-terminal peptidase prc